MNISGPYVNGVDIALRVRHDVLTPFHESTAFVRVQYPATPRALGLMVAPVSAHDRTGLVTLRVDTPPVIHHAFIIMHFVRINQVVLHHRMKLCLVPTAAPTPAH